MAHEGSFDSVLAVKGFFEGEDDKHAVNVTPHATNAVFLPRPELRADEVDDRNAEPAECASQGKIHIGEVNEDGGVGPLLRDAGLELAILAVDARDVLDDLGDAHDGDVFCADDATETERLHAL